LDNKLLVNFSQVGEANWTSKKQQQQGKYQNWFFNELWSPILATMKKYMNIKNEGN